jgi:hypothetical protein
LRLREWMVQQKIMRLLTLILILITMVSGSVRADKSDPEALTVVAEGMAAVESDLAAAEEEAIWDAKRNAVEKVVGVFVRARSVGRDFEIEESEIRSEARGFVKTWEKVPGSERTEKVGNGKILRLEVRATVALLPVIRHLSDIEDVYADLERPRIRVEVTGDSIARRAQSALHAAIRDQGFETSTSESAEIVLSGKMEIVPTVKLGAKGSPYGISDSVAACRARLVLHVISTASEEVLFTSQVEGVGCSFASDADARSEAVTDAARKLLAQNQKVFTQRLLVRWARERQEGHVVAVKVTGLDRHSRALLKEQIRAMRGFVRFVGESGDAKQITLRFHTRLDTRGLRRRLSDLRLNRTALAVKNERGPLVVCAAQSGPRLTRR